MAESSTSILPSPCDLPSEGASEPGKDGGKYECELLTVFIGCGLFNYPVSSLRFGPHS